MFEKFFVNNHVTHLGLAVNRVNRKSQKPVFNTHLQSFFDKHNIYPKGSLKFAMTSDEFCSVNTQMSDACKYDRSEPPLSGLDLEYFELALNWAEIEFQEMRDSTESSLDQAISIANLQSSTGNQFWGSAFLTKESFFNKKEN